MKKVLFVILGLFFMTSIVKTNAQQVEKNYVVVEIATGTWCGYCPGAAMGADELVENGHQVAIIENHNGDSYANASSNARNSYYAVPGYPTTNFNGGNPLVGGSATTSLYGAFVPRYDAAISVLSDFSLDLNYVKTGLDFEVTINVDEVGNYAGENLKVYLAFTESHIPENWGGLTEVNFVNRGMYPNQYGTAYTGGTETFTINFTANSNWDLENSELVAFVQDTTTKEILQADRVFLKALPANSDTVTLEHVLAIPDLCFGGFTPSLLVKNQGNNTITSMDISYSINSGATTGVYNWTGEIAFNEYGKVTFDTILFNLLENNTIEYEITTINGQADVDPSDNTGNTSFHESPEIVSNIVNLELHTDAYGSECTWRIVDYLGNVLESGGPYGNNQTINETYTLPGADCYSFVLVDEYGDGGGMVRLKDDANQVIYYTSGSYGAGYTQAFKTPGAGASVDDTAFVNTLIYPNPANTILNIDNAAGLNLSLSDVLGRVLIKRNAILEIEHINIESLKEGTYFLKLTDGNKVRTEKILIAK